MQAAPLPTVTRTGEAATDRNFDAIHTAFARLRQAPSVSLIIRNGLVQIPAGSVGAGVVQAGIQSATTIGGIIPAATNNSIDVTVDTGLVVNGMETEGLQSGTVLWLCFLNACKVAHGATVAAGQAPFHLGFQFAPNGINWNPTTGTKHTRGRITVKFYDATYSGGPFFELVGGPNA